MSTASSSTWNWPSAPRTCSCASLIRSSSPDRLHAVVERLVPRHVLADEERREHLLERVAVGVDDRLAVFAGELGGERLLRGDALGVRLGRGLLEHLFEGFLVRFLELRPDVAADDRD